MPAQFDAYFEALDDTVLSLMGETCTYLPKSGGSRTVTAAVDETSEQMDDQFGSWLVTTLRVLESTESDGIPAPIFGDAICRERDHLETGVPDPKKLASYAGVFDEKGPRGTVYGFTRKVPYELGGNRR